MSLLSDSVFDDLVISIQGWYKCAYNTDEVIHNINLVIKKNKGSPEADKRDDNVVMALPSIDRVTFFKFIELADRKDEELMEKVKFQGEALWSFPLKGHRETTYEYVVRILMHLFETADKARESLSADSNKRSKLRSICYMPKS